jgi:hypothetical protein
MWRIGRASNSITIYSYIQQDATSHSLFISGNYSTCFGWYFHTSSGAHTTVSTASGICHTVTAICHCPYGQHFFVDILCCIHIFCPQKTHNATLLYRGTCIKGRRHLVTAATSVVMRIPIVVNHNKTR